MITASMMSASSFPTVPIASSHDLGVFDSDVSNWRNFSAQYCCSPGSARLMLHGAMKRSSWRGSMVNSLFPAAPKEDKYTCPPVRSRSLKCPHPLDQTVPFHTLTCCLQACCALISILPVQRSRERPFLGSLDLGDLPANQGFLLGPSSARYDVVQRSTQYILA